MYIDISTDKLEIGDKAASAGARIIRSAIQERGLANIVLATGVSQFAMLSALASETGIDWARVTVFHLDEYAGMPATHPASFRRFLTERFLEKLPMPVRSFQGIAADRDLVPECLRLASEIERHPVDLCYLGIGANGHLAFNDPPADFETPAPYLVVSLDEACRRQQLEEGWFSAMSEVPTSAISMSIRRIMRSRDIVCIASGAHKADVVKATIDGSVTPSMPASILQLHRSVTFFLDSSSASRLEESQSSLSPLSR